MKPLPVTLAFSINHRQADSRVTAEPKTKKQNIKYSVCIVYCSIMQAIAFSQFRLLILVLRLNFGREPKY